MVLLGPEFARHLPVSKPGPDEAVPPVRSEHSLRGGRDLLHAAFHALTVNGEIGNFHGSGLELLDVFNRQTLGEYRLTDLAPVP